MCLPKPEVGSCHETKVPRSIGGAGRRDVMGRPPIGERAMTDAERMRRCRERHARRHPETRQRVATMDDLKGMLPTADDWDRWLGRKPWDDDEV